MTSLWTRVAKSSRRSGQILGHSVLTVAYLGMLCLPPFAWMKEHVATLTVINGASMYPYLNEDKDTTTTRDVLLSNRWAAKENLARGMIVTLRSPRNPETVAVKRIVALEGDTVRTREPYPSPTVKVPQGHVWVQGDGREDVTLDSNTYGPVSVQMITGKLTHILLPVRKFGPIKWWEHDSALGSKWR